MADALVAPLIALAIGEPPMLPIASVIPGDKSLETAQHDAQEGDIIILHTADDVAILATFSLLAKYSSFFSALKDLPRPAEDEETVIPLPSASSTGLALVISVLEDHSNTGTAGDTVGAAANEIDWSTITEVDLEHVTSAMQVADAYDIPAFMPHYISKVHRAIGADPRLAFTMAALAKDEAKAAVSARKLLRPVKQLSDGMQSLCKAHSPEYLVALTLFQDKYPVALQALRADLRERAWMTNGFNDYGIKCGRTNGCGCDAHDAYPSFRKLRRAYADSELERLIEHAFSGGDYYRVEVGCHKCSTRISGCFRRAVDQFRPKLRAFAV